MEDQIRAVFEDALVRLAAHLEVDRFELDEDGTIGFDFADDVSCSVEVPPGSGYFHLHGTVMRLPAIGRETFLAALLRQNLFGLSLPGAWLAIDGDEVKVCRSVAGKAFEAEDLPGLLLGLTEELRTLRRTLVSRQADCESGINTGVFIRG